MSKRAVFLAREFAVGSVLAPYLKNLHVKGFLFFSSLHFCSYLRQLDLLILRGSTGRCAYTGVGAPLTAPALLCLELS